MQTFDEYKNYIISNTHHAENNSRKQVHIILDYPLLPFGDFYKQLMGLTWFTGIRRGDNTDKEKAAIFAKTLDEGCAEADNFDYALVSYVGTVYRTPSLPADNIWTMFDQWIENESEQSPCKGHILWHPNKQYGRLHLQSMFLDLKHWRSVGRPSFGKWTGTASVPVVCKQNIHDDYTPLWLKPGTEKKDVVDAEMAEYITALLVDGKQVLNFTTEERHLKYFTYPQREEVSAPLNQDKEQVPNIIYRNNTSHFSTLERFYNEYNGPKYDVIYAPASGAVGEYLWTKFGHSNTKLIFFDNNKPSVIWKDSLYGAYSAGNARVTSVDQLDRITEIVARRYGCYVDVAEYKANQYGEFWSDQQWVDTINSVQDVDMIELDCMTQLPSIDPSKRNLVYLTNIFSYVFSYFHYSIDYMDIQFNKYCSLPNTTVMGVDPFREKIICQNH